MDVVWFFIILISLLQIKTYSDLTKYFTEKRKKRNAVHFQTKDKYWMMLASIQCVAYIAEEQFLNSQR